MHVCTSCVAVNTEVVRDQSYRIILLSLQTLAGLDQKKLKEIHNTGLFFLSVQTLARSGLPDPLCVSATRHAAQEGGGMAGAAQLPPWHGRLYGRAVQGSAQAKVQLPQTPADRGESPFVTVTS